MLYCNSCAEKNDYPKTIFKSYGCCEICGEMTDCNNVKSSKLPKED